MREKEKGDKKKRVSEVRDLICTALGGPVREGRARNTCRALLGQANVDAASALSHRGQWDE